MSMPSIIAPPTPGHAAPCRRHGPKPPRPGYLELKANVHRKLLNRLNLEALASADRARAPSPRSGRCCSS